MRILCYIEHILLLVTSYVLTNSNVSIVIIKFDLQVHLFYICFSILELFESRLGERNIISWLFDKQDEYANIRFLEDFEAQISWQ